MSADHALLARIRGEYREMPGLRLTLHQACRLWQLDGATCLELLEQLVKERCLYRMHDDTYSAFPSVHPKPAKATLPAARRKRPARRLTR